jgi:hypothetical protein
MREAAGSTPAGSIGASHSASRRRHAVARSRTGTTVRPPRRVDAAPSSARPSAGRRRARLPCRRVASAGPTSLSAQGSASSLRPAARRGRLRALEESPASHGGRPPFQPARAKNPGGAAVAGGGSGGNSDDDLRFGASCRSDAEGETGDSLRVSNRKRELSPRAPGSGHRWMTGRGPRLPNRSRLTSGRRDRLCRTWLSPARARARGSRGHRLESCRPDRTAGRREGLEPTGLHSALPRARADAFRRCRATRAPDTERRDSEVGCRSAPTSLPPAGRSSAWPERSVRGREAARSNRAAPIQLLKPKR